MIRYIPASAAEPLSNALWGLTRPPQVRQPSGTQYLFAWLDDVSGERWLKVDTTFTIPVHAEAELDGIADILQPWIDSGHLPANTNDTLAALVESKRGQDLTVYDAFPQLFKDMSLTTAQMIAAGKLANPQVP